MGEYDRVKEWRKKQKARAVEAMGGECVCCGYDKCLKAMDFHHLDPSCKEFTVSSKIRSWTRIVEELRKCVLVCCRCHTEVHAGAIVIPSSARRFDEKYAKDGPTKDFDLCPVCGGTKSKSAKTCSRTCADKVRPRIEWASHDLLGLRQTHSIEAIGRMLGVSGNAIRRQLRKRTAATTAESMFVS